jgi:hypothetical protein
MRRNALPALPLVSCALSRFAFQATTLAAAIAAALLTPAATRAQSASAGPAMGVWAGMTSATFRGSDAPGPTYLAGFSAAFFAKWHLASHLALQPELQYTQKGSDEVDATGGGPVYTMHIRLSYVEVPVLLRVEASPMGSVTPFALVGPDVAFKVGCGVVVSGLPGNYGCASLPAAESVDYGGLAGVGLAFNVRGRTYGLSARYDAGVANAFSGNNAKNRAVTILLGTVIR